jgi:hypothetical protein
MMQNEAAKVQHHVDTSSLFLYKKAPPPEIIRIFVQIKIWLT